MPGATSHDFGTDNFSYNFGPDFVSIIQSYRQSYRDVADFDPHNHRAINVPNYIWTHNIPNLITGNLSTIIRSVERPDYVTHDQSHTVTFNIITNSVSECYC